MSDEKISVSPLALAELEMIVREATEEKCRYIEKRLLLTLERAIRAEKTAADLQSDLDRHQHIHGNSDNAD